MTYDWQKEASKHLVGRTIKKLNGLTQIVAIDFSGGIDNPVKSI